jgi:hypothetical protein
VSEQTHIAGCRDRSTPCDGDFDRFVHLCAKHCDEDRERSEEQSAKQRERDAARRAEEDAAEPCPGGICVKATEIKVNRFLFVTDDCPGCRRAAREMEERAFRETVDAPAPALCKECGTRPVEMPLSTCRVCWPEVKGELDERREQAFAASIGGDRGGER